jgi:hypothetical protein
MKVRLQIAAALPVMAGIAWFGRQWGPKPAFPADTTITAAAVPEPDPATALSGIDIGFGILGATRTLKAQGCEKMPSDAFFDGLVAGYRNAGYGSLEFTQPKRDRRPALLPARGMLWRNRTGEIQILGVIPPPAAASPQPIEVTAGMATEKCGVRWKTFSYSAPNRPPAPSDDALPDAAPDADDFPRPQGSRRLFRVTGPSGGEVRAYSAMQSPDELRAWYRREMSNRWQEETQSPNSTLPLRDAMYFRRDREYCLIWVAPEVTGGKSLTMISTGYE